MWTLVLALACRTAPTPEPPVAPGSDPSAGAGPEPAAAVTPAPGRGPENLHLGSWDAELVGKGGPVRFGLHVDESCRVEVRTADQSFPTVAECAEGTLSLKFPPYLGSLTARIESDGDALRGQYDYDSRGEWVHMPFRAEPAKPPQWIPAPEGAPSAVSLQLDGKGVVLLELRPGEGNGLYASVSAPTGDWGPLQGGWTEDGLVLTGFDTGHAFRMVLAPDEDGRLAGQVWSRAGDARGVHETEAETDLDGWDAIQLARVDLAGIELQRIGGEVEPLPTEGPRIVHLSGTWCPNCSDAAPVIEALAAQHPDVKVIGLSWEAGAPPARADRQIERFRDRFSVTHPLYRLDAAPPFLDPVPAWPTTLFLRADGTVSAAHVGFLGPSTGARFEALVERYRQEAAALTAP